MGEALEGASGRSPAPGAGELPGRWWRCPLIADGACELAAPGLSTACRADRVTALPAPTIVPNRSQNATTYPITDAELFPLEPIQSCILVLRGVRVIAETDDGDLVVQQVGTPDAPALAELARPSAPEGQCFAKEFHLRDFLASNLNVIEDGLQLYADDEGTNGVEYRIDMGRIDILAVDRDGGLLIIELKVDRGPDEVCGQIMRYVGWVKHHLANGRRVRGLIIARHISDRIRYAIADVPDVTAREYVMQITLAPVAPVGS